MHVVKKINLRYPLRTFKANVMKSISLKFPEGLLESTNRCARALEISRAEYIRRAVERMNRESEARAHAERMSQISRRVRTESMRVNAEFAAIERAPKCLS